MVLQIKKAQKFGAKARIALYGPSGSGKTYTALSIAQGLKGEKRIVVIDSERKTASKYADLFDFDVIELDDFHPSTYVEAIRLATKSKEHSVLIIDSATQEWDGTRGALELAGHNFANWANVTPLHNAFVDAMLSSDVHLLVTMRAKEEHVMEESIDTAGRKKTTVRKIGMEPIQRKGMIYEFDIVGRLELDNSCVIEKTRCSAIKDAIYPSGSEAEFVSVVSAWLSGVPRQYTVEDIKKRANKLYPRAKAAKCCTSPQDYSTFIAKVLELDIVSIDTLTMADLDAVEDVIVENEPAA